MFFEPRSWKSAQQLWACLYAEASTLSSLSDPPTGKAVAAEAIANASKSSKATAGNASETTAAGTKKEAAKAAKEAASNASETTAAGTKKEAAKAAKEAASNASETTAAGTKKEAAKAAKEAASNASETTAAGTKKEAAKAAKEAASNASETTAAGTKKEAAKAAKEAASNASETAAGMKKEAAKAAKEAASNASETAAGTKKEAAKAAKEAASNASETAAAGEERKVGKALESLLAAASPFILITGVSSCRVVSRFWSTSWGFQIARNPFVIPGRVIYIFFILGFKPPSTWVKNGFDAELLQTLWKPRTSTAAFGSFPGPDALPAPTLAPVPRFGDRRETKSLRVKNTPPSTLQGVVFGGFFNIKTHPKSTPWRVLVWVILWLIFISVFWASV